jgi:DNA-binding transcriptional regulator GbsR (MarR family)
MAEDRSDPRRSTEDAQAPAEHDVYLDADRQDFVEDLAVMMNHAAGLPLTDGRVLGYLMMTQADHTSSAQLAQGLQASSGAISMATRRLVESGFVKRHVIPGDRRHYFRTETDVWGSWLATERRYLDRQRDVIARGLATTDPDDPADAPVRERLENGRDYMTWLQGHHRAMLEEWEAFKAERRSGSRKKRSPTTHEEEG